MTILLFKTIWRYNFQAEPEEGLAYKSVIYTVHVLLISEAVEREVAE